MKSCFTIQIKDNLPKTTRFLKAIQSKKGILLISRTLEEYGRIGCFLLSKSTPIRTGETASSWTYKVSTTSRQVSLVWYNNSMADDGKTPVVVLIINGHGTGTGGYVQANDFVKPVISPLCREAADAVWMVVKNL